ncbi:MAG: SAM-dependent chlorinase/fluorinase [Cyanobacteria bacterium J06648_16]
MSLITLMTDFGTCNVYVGVMKGVIAQIAPQVPTIDLTHAVPPQDIVTARFNLMSSCPYFPEGTVHCVVVDPGVGTARRAVAVEAQIQGQTQYFVAPDNGVLDGILAEARRAVSLTCADYWRLPMPSQTFHGRDVFAPVAAHLAIGVGLARLGKAVLIESLVRLQTEDAIAIPNGYRGCIQYIDGFGNAITNLGAEILPSGPWQIQAGGQSIVSRATYGEAATGTLLALVGSDGWVEIAVNRGSAADCLNLQVGSPVTLTWETST